jgi:hypothetical protein
MSGLYRVHSTHVNELTGDTWEELETQRTEPKVAQEDAYLIRTILHRRTRVEEVK